MDIQVFDENGKPLHIADVISRLKFKLEVNAGRLAEPLLKEGKQLKEDEECHKAFLMLAHLAEIEDYINGLNVIGIATCAGVRSTQLSTETKL